MSIKEFLKSNEKARVVFEDKWMYWDSMSNTWVIMIQEPHKLKRTLEITNDEEKAIRILRGKDE